MKGIPVVELPKTFRDAITTTLNLGIDYIWIDALCVVADDAQDVAIEMTRVHDIFSGAYFVIAASRAAAQDDGFLKRHLQRDFVTFLDDSNDPFYVCEAIDDFDQDVLAGRMHQRAWTFQERAFARRTIFFGENQMYFECGGGIRCKTLSLMHNPIATLLGDPNFPNLAEKEPLFRRITLFQSMYSYYSRLKLTQSIDRSIAVAGIETRMARAFKVDAAFGIFGGHMLHWSLLWFRAPDEDKLERIYFKGRPQPPSWSWTSCVGSIDYIHIDSEITDWLPLNVSLPQTDDSVSTRKTELVANAYELSSSTREDDARRIIYDDPSATDSEGQMYIVLGMSNDDYLGPWMGKNKLFVLCIAPNYEKEGQTTYRRIGAGVLDAGPLLNKGEVHVE